MKQRIITAVVAAALFIAVMFGYQTVVLNIMVSALIGLAIWELFHATGLLKHRALYILSTVYGMAMPFVVMLDNGIVNLAGMGAYAFLLFVLAMKQHETLHFSEVCMAYLLSNLFPFCFLSLLLTRYEDPANGIFYLLLICLISWGGDTMAYFSGRFLGKHKLAPVISPKKTVEGLIGGVIGSVIAAFLLSFFYAMVVAKMGAPVTMRYAVILPAAAVLSLISVFGDLSCSLIKRQYGIKDYGTIFPGHGGVMDRFDSVLMVAPFVLFGMKLLPVVLPV